MAFGSVLGLIISPLVIGVGEAAAHHIGQDPLGLPWLLLPLLIIAGMVLIGFVRPDPKQIGTSLELYYPGYVPPPPRSTADSAPFSVAGLVRYAPTRLAIVSNAAAQGNMSIVMVLTSLVLAHHGHSLMAIAFSHMFHTIGMFAFTIPLGMLADRLGRQQVMVPGVAMTLLGAGFVAFTTGFWLVTLGTFLVGLGWAAANVAATALIADDAETAERGRAIGVADSVAGAISVLTALVTGPVIARLGMPAAGTAAVALAVVPLVIWLIDRRGGLAARVGLAFLPPPGDFGPHAATAAQWATAVILLRPLAGFVSALFTLLMLAGASVADTHGREAELRPFSHHPIAVPDRDGCIRSVDGMATERADAEDDPELLAIAFGCPEIAPQFAPVLAIRIRADLAPVRRRPCASPPTGPPAA